MVTLEQFKKNAKEHGICEMLSDWDNAKSKKQLMDIALSARGIPYVAESIAQGWGISEDVIATEFKAFLNGRYERNADGYSSALFCDIHEGISVTTTCALIIGYKGVICVDRPIAELYICNSDVTVVSNVGGKANVYLYNSKIVNNDFVVIKERKNY